MNYRWQALPAVDQCDIAMATLEGGVLLMRR
jgi:hypothetical protein